MRGYRLFLAAGVGLLAMAPASAQTPQVARGEYLVTGLMACGNCHTQKDAQLQPKANLALAGGEKFSSPGFGLAYSKNLTPDVDTGIGTWSNEQIVRAIREGVSREGAPLGPPMPVRLYNKMSNDDANAVAAYLKSLKPVRNEVPEAKYKIPLTPAPPAAGTPAPPVTDMVAYGGYLTTMAHCFECHTPPGEGGRPDTAKFGAGGRMFFPVEGKPVRSANITSDKETGLGNWTDEQI
jgi:mono/diheme cytochrome c family protein